MWLGYHLQGISGALIQGISQEQHAEYELEGTAGVVTNVDYETQWVVATAPAALE